MLTIRSLLEWAALQLRNVSLSPRLDAELLLSFVSKLSRVEMISSAFDTLDPKIEARFKELVERRKNSEPVAYLTGKREFFALEFEVSPKVLVPRPETELLVELVVDSAKRRGRRVKILDLGTGSGCIAIASANALRKLGIDFEFMAIDADDEALEVARRNATHHNLSDRILFAKSNWFTELVGDGQRFDIIVSNPPYIAVGDSELSPETSFEPQHALFAGSDGLECIRELIIHSPAYLKSAGTFLCEMGSGQRSAIELLVANLLNVPGRPRSRLSFSTDLAGHDRVFALEFD